MSQQTTTDERNSFAENNTTNRNTEQIDQFFSRDNRAFLYTNTAMFRPKRNTTVQELTEVKEKVKKLRVLQRYLVTEFRIKIIKSQFPEKMGLPALEVVLS